MSASNWFARMLEYMAYPADYIVFDCETSGLHATQDLIVQIGYCIVQDHEVCFNSSLLLDWTRFTGKQFEQSWLRDKMAYTKHQMEKAGHVFPMTYEKLHDEGVEPLAALASFRDLCLDARGRGDFFLAHNSWGFDIPRIERHMERFLGDNFEFEPNEVFDTGLMEKANQLDLFPYPAESRHAFYLRVRSRIATKTYWSLDRHCIGKYELEKKYGLDRTKAHDAAFDCLATHYLFQEFRKLAEAGAGHNGGDGDGMRAAA